MGDILKPEWFEDEKINEVLFCTDFLAAHPMRCISGQFYSPEGRISDENQLKKMIYDLLKPYITTNLNKKVTNLMVETLVTTSPEFFENKNRNEIQDFFREALDFFVQNQRKDTIISAVVHMDEKTPHMHMTFMPLTQDNRLSAKEIVGNNQKLTLWQDQFWSHMVEKYPDLERGESASLTGRTHIPPRLFKEATKLERLQEQIKQLMGDVNPFNAKKRVAKLEELLKLYIPKVEEMITTLKKYETAFRELEKERAAMEKQKVSLQKETIDLRGQNFELSWKYARDRKRLYRLERAIEKVPKGILDLYFKMEEQKDKDKENER